MKTGDVVAGRFVLGELIGQGGMGVVFRALDRTDNTPVALKALKLMHPHAAQRFIREAQMLEALSHPNIVRYVAHGQTEEGELYLAMEWLDGEDLSQRLRRGALSIDETSSLIRALAETLGAAHQQGIIHRDIKPQNIFLLRGQQRIKLLDFGIARLGGVFSDVTATGAIMGTPGYLAPEQATRGAKGLEASADIFSLGCVFFECLAGRMPFVGENALSVLSKILLADAPKIRQTRPEVPEAIERLIIEMMNKEPASRPKDGAELLERLDSISEHPPSAQSTERPRRITTGEQSFLCVVLLGRTPQSKPDTEQSQTTVESGELSSLQREVERFGGRLHLLIDGSGVATFARVGAATDLAAQAARCALSLQTKIPEVPIAVATGRADLSQTMPVGEVIDRAILLLQSTLIPDAQSKDTSIWIDEATAGLLHHRFELSNRVDGFELKREQDLAEPTRTFLGKALPCVGRERELANLEAMAQDCIEEPALKIALVTAGAGIGKSRLRQELLLNLSQRGLAFERLLCRAEPLRANSSFALIGLALRQSAGIHDDDPLPLKQKKLRVRASRHLPEKQAALVSDFLGELAGVPSSAAGNELLQAARREPQVMAAQVQRHFEEFLRAELGAYPVLLLLEDLHWADAATIKLLDGAMRSLAEHPLFVLALARPEVRTAFPELWSRHSMSEIGLGALSKKSAERLIRQSLGEVSPEKMQQLIELSQGNAFYLEELCRCTAENPGTLPSTVVAMMSARLDSFSPEERRLVRAASVFGEGFWLGGVQALVDMPDRESLRAQLKPLLEREIIAQRGESRINKEEEFGFRHALLREAAYAMFTEGDKRLAHQLAAEWLAAGRESDPLVLAKHFELGGVTGRALDFYTQAANRARATLSNDTTIPLIEKALSLGPQGAQRGELLAYLTEACLWRSDLENILTYGQEALSLLPKDSPIVYRLRVWILAFQIATAPDEALPQIREIAKEPFAGGELGSLQIFVWGNLLFQTALAGYCKDAHRLYARVIENEAHAQDHFTLANVFGAKAMAAYILDADPWAMRECLKEAVVNFQSCGEEILAHHSLLHQVVAELMLGDFEGSLQQLEALYQRGLSLLGEGAYLLQMFKLYALYWLGRYDEACAIAEEIGPISARLNPLLDEPLILAMHAKILLHKKESTRAHELATRSLVLSMPLRACALDAMMEVKLATGQIDEALALLRERARGLADLGIEEPFTLTSRAAYIKVLDAAGLHEESKQKLSELVAFIHQRAAAITEDKYRESFLNTPDHQHLLALAKARLP